MNQDISQIEALVIGAVIQYPERFDDCQLQASDFQSVEHRQYFECILAAAAKNQLNPFAVRDIFRQETGSTNDLILDYSTNALQVTSQVFPQYVELVKAHSHKSKALRIASKMIDDLNGGNIESIGEAISDLMNLDRSDEKYDHSFADIAHMAVDAYEKAEMGTTGAVKTGFTDIDERIGGYHPGDLYIIAARPAMGKDQPLHSKILMSDGTFKRMGDIAIGDKLASVDGADSYVSNIFPQGIKQTYKLKLKDGREIECGAGHLWRVKSCRFKEDRTVTTTDLIDMLSKERYSGRIRLVGHVGDFGNDTLSIDPWVLGFLLGDGSLISSVKFSTGEQEILDKIKSKVGDDFTIKHAGKYDYSITMNGSNNTLKDQLCELGVFGCRSYEKFIPEICFTQSLEFRQQLLAGLIESDGWVESSAIMFSSSSERLTNDVRILVNSLGGTAFQRVKTKVNYTYKGETKKGRDAHVLSISLNDNAFTTSRIAGKLKPRVKDVEPIIISVDEFEKTETQCITVTHDSSLYITDGYCVTHNTAFMVNSFLKANTSIGVISAEQGAEQIGVRSICIEGKVNHQNFRRARMEPDEFHRFRAALDEFQLMNGRLYDKPAPTILEVEKTARRWVHKHNVGAIYIDYAQRLGHENKRLSSVERNSDIAKRLKELARTLNVPVIALAQVNRQCESRNDKRPLMGDIADASAYEKEADVIFTLYRDEVYNDDSNEKGVLEANFEKNRHGGTGRVILRWEGQFMQVTDFNNYERQQDHFYKSDGYI